MKNSAIDAKIRSLTGYGPMTPTAKDEESIQKRAQELARFGVERPSQRGLKADLEAGKRVLVQRGMPLPMVRTVDGSDASIIEFIAASGGKKRDGNSVDNSGWQFGSFADNPVFLWCHDYTGLPLGHHVAWAVDKLENQPVLRTGVKFASKDVYPFADTVRKLYLNRDLRTVSAGWIPLQWRELDEGGILFIKNELLEVSGCPIPADPKALMAACQRGVISNDELDNCARWLPALALARDVAYVLSNVRVVGSEAEDEKPEKVTGDEDSTNDAESTDEGDAGEGIEDAEGTEEGTEEGEEATSGEAEARSEGDGTGEAANGAQAAPGAQGGGDPAAADQTAGRSAGRVEGVKPAGSEERAADGTCPTDGKGKKKKMPANMPPKTASAPAAVVQRDIYSATMQPGQARGVLSDKMDLAFDKVCGPAILVNDVLYDVRMNINGVYWDEGDGFEVRPQGLRRAINRLQGLNQQISDGITELDDACSAAEQAVSPDAGGADDMGMQAMSVKDVNAKVRKAQAQQRLGEIEKMQATIGEIAGRLKEFAVDLSSELDEKSTKRNAAVDPAIEKLRAEVRAVADSFRGQDGAQSRAENDSKPDESSAPENGSESKDGSASQEGEDAKPATTMEDVLSEMRKWSAPPAQE